jgi:hypothetical protein
MGRPVLRKHRHYSEEVKAIAFALSSLLGVLTHAATMAQRSQRKNHRGQEKEAGSGGSVRAGMTTGADEEAQT